MKELTTFWQQTLGYLWYNKEPELLFVLKKPKRMSIHTWFMRFPITIQFLDEQKRVIEQYANVEPFSYIKPFCQASYIREIKEIELVHGKYY